MALQAGAQSPLYGESSTFLVGTGDAGGAPSWASGFAQGMETLGPVVSIFGAVNGAIGSFYAAQNQQNQLRMQAQNQAFSAEMGRINQRAARYTAAQLNEAGQQQAGAYTMRAGQARAGARAAMAGRGIQLGTGSAREVIGSTYNGPTLGNNYHGPAMEADPMGFVPPSSPNKFSECP